MDAETYGCPIQNSAENHTRVPNYQQTYPTQKSTVPSPHPMAYVVAGY